MGKARSLPDLRGSTFIAVRDYTGAVSDLDRAVEVYLRLQRVTRGAEPDRAMIADCMICRGNAFRKRANCLLRFKTTMAPSFSAKSCRGTSLKGRVFSSLRGRILAEPSCSPHSRTLFRLCMTWIARECGRCCTRHGLCSYSAWPVATISRLNVPACVQRRHLFFWWQICDHLRKLAGVRERGDADPPPIEPDFPAASTCAPQRKRPDRPIDRFARSPRPGPIPGVVVISLTHCVQVFPHTGPRYPRRLRCVAGFVTIYTIRAGPKRHRIEPWAYLNELILQFSVDAPPDLSTRLLPVLWEMNGDATSIHLRGQHGDV